MWRCSGSYLIVPGSRKRWSLKVLFVSVTFPWQQDRIYKAISCSLFTSFFSNWQERNCLAWNQTHGLPFQAHTIQLLEGMSLERETMSLTAYAHSIIQHRWHLSTLKANSVEKIGVSHPPQCLTHKSLWLRWLNVLAFWAANQVAYWLIVSPGRWGWTRVGISQQAFFQGWLFLWESSFSLWYKSYVTTRHWSQHDYVIIGHWFE